MCSLTIGMCLEWAWCTPTIEIDNPNAHKHEYQMQSLTNVLYFGAIVSAGPAAFVASLLGLRSVLVIGLGITTCGSIVVIYSTGAFLWLYIGRILHGLGAGIVFVIVPNYTLEIAESKLRGEYYVKINLNVYYIDYEICFHCIPTECFYNILMYTSIRED